MFYYNTVSYDIASLYLNEASHLHGPFATTELRDVAINEELEDFDDTEYIINVTFLKIVDGKLVHEKSFLLGGEDGDESEWNDDEDDEDDELGDEDDELGDEDEDDED